MPRRSGADTSRRFSSIRPEITRSRATCSVPLFSIADPFCDHTFPRAHPLAEIDRNPIIERYVMVNAAAEHDQPDPLAAIDPLRGPHPAYDPARQIAGD